MRRAVLLASALSLLAFMSCAGPESARPHQLKVVTTLFPLFDMARSVGAEQADVSLLLPPGIEPHAFEPSAGQVMRIYDADVFIYAGRYMEPWAEGIAQALSDRGKTVVDASQGIRLMTEEGEPAGAPDPHIWLDFDNARVMVAAIARALAQKDTAAAALYFRRAEDYAAHLLALDSTYRVTLAACPRREVFYGGHYAFGYLARRYGLTYLTAQGTSPDAEPTARYLAQLVDRIRQDRVRCVFYDELAGPRIAEVLAEATNARLIPLNAGHNLTRAQLNQGMTFFALLEQDLARLKLGLSAD
jgi:zinc transport system substrate-binding protein